jgi:osmotically-inducible protein OsmY
MNRNMSFVVGLTCGAGLMYVLDPGGGRRRRALLRDQVRHAVRKTSDGLDAASRDAANRMSGRLADARGRLRHEHVADPILVERVRAEMGRVVSHPRAIDVEARNGTVRLCGPILASEVNPLMDAVRSVSGVTGIDNQLDVHQEPGNIPSLQGGGSDDSRAPGKYAMD